MTAQPSTRENLRAKIAETKARIKKEEEDSQLQTVIKYFSARIEKDFIEATDQVMTGKSIQTKWSHTKQFDFFLSDGAMDEATKILHALVPSFDFMFSKKSTAYTLTVDWS